jgi:hypothetical protein
MIVVQLCGGLGNQMFQYAFGRRLALEQKAPLWLDIAAFGAAAPGETPRQYRLDHFKIDGRILPPCMAFFLPFPRRMPRRLSWARWPGLLRKVREKGHPYDATAANAKGNLYVEGFWQTEKYFAQVPDAIRADFALREPMTPQRQELAAQMGPNAVSVHVRRGDYVTNTSANAFHGTCSPEWYKQAMDRMAAALPGATFFVFSDDPDWSRDNLPRYDGTVFVNPQPDGRDYEDMHLMARCAHHIIANSSYSWWGAWLNPSMMKKVIAPARWFAKEDGGPDRIPAAWTKL